MGLPMVTGSSRRSRLAADQMVVSVGPYRFQASPRATSWSLRPSGNASPPHNTLTPSVFCHPTRTSMAQVAGVACMMVGRQSATFSASSVASATVADSPMQTWPPVISGR
ncbi:hypothetical protein SMICM17S_00629 [Streptomyces microflavus]